MFKPISEGEWIQIAAKIYCLEGNEGEAKYHHLRGMHCAVEMLEEMRLKDYKISIREAVHDLNITVRAACGLSEENNAIKI